MRHSAGSTCDRPPTGIAAVHAAAALPSKRNRRKKSVGSTKTWTPTVDHSRRRRKHMSVRRASLPGLDPAIHHSYGKNRCAVISARDKSDKTRRLRAAVRAATSAWFFRGGLGICAALSIRRYRVADRIHQRFGETVVAPVVHMQQIRRQEYLERDAVNVVPVPHEREAVKHVDVLLLGRTRNELDHVCTFRPREHLRRELRIDQNDIGADRFYSPYPFVDQRVGFRVFVASEDGVGAELPEHQVRTLGSDALVEAGEHVDDPFATDAAVEDDDRLGWEPPRKFGHEPARIGRLRRACTRACRRGRTERNDHDETMRSQAARGARQRQIEPGEISWRDTARDARVYRRGRRRDGEQAP